MRRQGILIALAVAAVGATAAPARAGTYTVFACGSYDNRSWNSVGATGISADERCPGTSTMGNAVGGGARVPLGATGTTTFTAPTGMTIADFTLTRQLTYRNGAPADGTRRLYAIYKLGGTVFAGAGHYDNATRNSPPRRRQLVRLPGGQRRRADEHRLASRASRRSRATRATPPRCRSRSAASTAASTPPARWPRAAASRTCSPARRSCSTTRPLPTASIEATGLLAGGRRAGSDAVTLDAHRQRRHQARRDHRPQRRRRQRRRRRGLRRRRAHRDRRDLLVPPAQGLPERQGRARPPDAACRPGSGR